MGVLAGCSLLLLHCCANEQHSKEKQLEQALLRPGLLLTRVSWYYSPVDTDSSSLSFRLDNVGKLESLV